MAKNSELTHEAVEARRAYWREWRRKNSDKHREYLRKYWEKKAKEAADDKEAGQQ